MRSPIYIKMPERMPTQIDENFKNKIASVTVNLNSTYDDDDELVQAESANLVKLSFAHVVNDSTNEDGGHQINSGGSKDEEKAED